MAEPQKKPFHEQVAESLIAQLQQGTAPWQQPWDPGLPGSVLPLNPTTGKRYKGINALHLLSQGRSDQRWMTYKQAAAVGGQVRRGEKGTPIQYWKFSQEQTQTDEQGHPLLDSKGQPLKQEVRLERPQVFFATVFNAEQIDGLPPLARPEAAWDPIARIDQMLQRSGALIRHSEVDRAFYRPATDSIHLPQQSQFPSPDRYYATLLHELGHWTGHSSRLARDLAHAFGSEGYAREELRAEIASLILGDELGIGHDPSQHAAYVGTWIQVLQDDPLEIFRAAADAEKIQSYVLALEQQPALEAETLPCGEPQPNRPVIEEQRQLRQPDLAEVYRGVAATVSAKGLQGSRAIVQRALDLGYSRDEVVQMLYQSDPRMKGSLQTAERLVSGEQRKLMVVLHPAREQQAGRGMVQ
jgi:putative DNA primase/helicase